MLNVKLVIIGASGVGKTSLRTKYTSGRFSSSYRATIGADFITKTINHHSNPQEQITLQIWDTAGQERFSSLASAFFRGADAVVLVYDVTDPASLTSLDKWWSEFCDRAPVAEGKEAEFPVVFVGNKMDLLEPGAGSSRIRRQPSNEQRLIGEGTGIITKEQAQEYLEKLIPVPESLGNGHAEPETSSVPIASPTPAEASTNPVAPTSTIDPSSTPTPETPHLRSSSIATPAVPPARPRSHSRFTNGTMTTMDSVYHTASSSLLDSDNSVSSSVRPAANTVWPPNHSEDEDEGDIILEDSRASLRLPDQHSTSSSSTVTPRRSRSFGDSATDLAASSSPATSRPPTTYPLQKPDVGPKLFLTSAKTGLGLADMFDYIGNRVVKKWEYEESLMDMVEAAEGSRIILDGRSNESQRAQGWSCCS